MSPILRQRWLVAGCHAIALSLLALHFYVRTLPPTPTALPEADSAEAAWWGLWPITYLPTTVMLLAALLIVGWIIGWWGNKRWPWPPSRITHHASPITLLFTASSLLLLIAFYTFPIVHTRWGDAYLLSKAIAWPDPALRLTHSWQAPLDVYLHSQLWLGGHERFGWADAVPVYRLLSPVAGLLYLLAAWGLARDQISASGWLTFGWLTSLGVLQLFFGYIENYSFAAAGILLYLWLGVRAVAGQSPPWLAATMLALTNAFHPSTIILAPSLLYCGWVGWQQAVQSQNKTGRQAVFSTGAAIVLPMLLGGLAVIGLMEGGGHGLAALLTSDRPGGGDGRPFVPLWATTTRWEHYTMFSWLHLRDFLNQQMLVAPVVLPGLLLTGLAALIERVYPPLDSSATQVVDSPIFWEDNHAQLGATADESNRKDAKDAKLFSRFLCVLRASAVIFRAGLSRRSDLPAQPSRKMGYGTPALRFARRFLLIAALSYQLFIWVWNPDYGGQRDWDLFSLAAIPAALLLAIALPRRFTDSRYLLAGTIPLLMLQWLQLAAWLYQNTLPWDWPS